MLYTGLYILNKGLYILNIALYILHPAQNSAVALRCKTVLRQYSAVAPAKFFTGIAKRNPGPKTSAQRLFLEDKARCKVRKEKIQTYRVVCILSKGLKKVNRR